MRCSRSGRPTTPGRCPDDRCPGGGDAAGRHGLPLRAGSAGRCAGARGRVGRRVDRARAPGRRARPGRGGRPGTGFRDQRRAGDQGAVQRIRGPGGVRSGLLHPGPALAGRARVRRAAPARADHDERVRDGAVRGGGPDRGHLPYLHRAVPGAERLRRGGAGADGEGHRAHRGVPAGPPGAGGTPRRGRGGDPERGRRAAVRERPAAARLSAVPDGGFRRPVRRAAQGHGRAAGRPVPAGRGASGDAAALVTSSTGPSRSNRSAT